MLSALHHMVAIHYLRRTMHVSGSVYTHLKYCKTIHHDIFISAVGQEVETVSPGARLASKAIQQFLYNAQHKCLQH